MKPQPAPNLHRLREQRERAQAWINRASWTAMISSAVASCFIVGVMLSDPTITASATPVLSSLFGTGLVGYKLRERSQWAAWGLMVTYGASVATSVLVFNIWSGLLGKIIVGTIYVRGWLASIDYKELDEQIAALTASPTVEQATGERGS